MGTARDDGYRRLADLAHEMSQHLPDTTATAFDDLIAGAVTHIRAAQYAGVTVVATDGAVTTPASTGDHPRTLDALQQQHRQGPCFDAATDHDSYFIADLHTETRWPRFCSDALSYTPIRAIASYQLFNTHNSVGALNLYAEDPNAFNQHDRDLGYIFAAHAAIVWAAVERGEQFRSALASRDIIGQAKGMIMERYNLGPIQAFELLRRLSQETNTRIADLAQRLVNNEHPDSL
ncbi:GAF domain-containing protein [Williamsia limnetica]|uniref:GAF domain-containing protein n=1 Tax=Williamsia limnetica TaxID=882452 RepID=A0A318RVH1_WILLI|nr:GAF and ANTAR domain-containing protein [Williamsia limnetica]PYE13559.1 GAF domain-containing protein [Williamsia limnetica]